MAVLKSRPKAESESNFMIGQLIEMWRINNRINLMVMDAIDDKGFDTTLSTRGGRTIAQQFLHMHNVRINWLEHIAKDIFSNYSLLDKNEKVDRKKLRHACEQSGKAIEELIIQSSNNNFQLKAYKRGLMPFLGYLMTHDAHHRGNIFLTLKQTGQKIPEKLKWGIWEWDKI